MLGMKFYKTNMTPIKKALIISLVLHMAGLLGGEFFLKRARLKNNKIIYPIRLIEIAESSPKPIVSQPVPRKKKHPAKPVKPKPKIVKKKAPRKSQEPKKGVPVKKEAKKELPTKIKENEQVKEDKIKQEIKEEEEKKVSQAIEAIRKKKALALKEREENSEVSKKFIERQQQIYAAEIYSQIKRNWSIPETFSEDMGDFEAIVIIRLNPNGELADVRLEKPSGFHPFDESIIRAIKKAAPFSPPPLVLIEDEIEIGFHSDEMG